MVVVHVLFSLLVPSKDEAECARTLGRHHHLSQDLLYAQVLGFLLGSVW